MTHTMSRPTLPLPAVSTLSLLILRLNEQNPLLLREMSARCADAATGMRREVEENRATDHPERMISKRRIRAAFVSLSAEFHALSGCRFGPDDRETRSGAELRRLGLRLAAPGVQPESYELKLDQVSGSLGHRPQFCCDQVQSLYYAGPEIWLSAGENRYFRVQ